MPEILHASAAQAVHQRDRLGPGVRLGAIDGALQFPLQAHGLVVQTLRHEDQFAHVRQARGEMPHFFLEDIAGDDSKRRGGGHGKGAGENCGAP